MNAAEAIDIKNKFMNAVKAYIAYNTTGLTQRDNPAKINANNNASISNEIDTFFEIGRNERVRNSTKKQRPHNEDEDPSFGTKHILSSCRNSSVFLTCKYLSLLGISESLLTLKLMFQEQSSDLKIIFGVNSSDGMEYTKFLNSGLGGLNGKNSEYSTFKKGLNLVQISSNFLSNGTYNIIPEHTFLVFVDGNNYTIISSWFNYDYSGYKAPYTPLFYKEYKKDELEGHLIEYIKSIKAKKNTDNIDVSKLFGKNTNEKANTIFIRDKDRLFVHIFPEEFLIGKSTDLFLYPEYIQVKNYKPLSIVVIGLDDYRDDSNKEYKFKYLSRGIYGSVYVNKNNTRAMKVILNEGQYTDDDTFTQSVETEVYLQKRAAKNGLSLPIHYSGYYKPRDGEAFKSKCYLFTMDSLLNRYEYLYVYSHGQERKNALMEFIYKLVFNTKVSNTLDPAGHFYLDIKTKNIIMIDFGNATDLKDKPDKELKDEFIKMCKAVGIQIQEDKIENILTRIEIAIAKSKVGSQLSSVRPRKRSAENQGGRNTNTNTNNNKNNQYRSGYRKTRKRNKLSQKKRQNKNKKSKLRSRKRNTKNKKTKLTQKNRK